MAQDDAAVMTPVAAVARHLEWLDFALAAARDEEARRRERLGKATSKNREKRTVRLAEVSAEVRELAALVKGLKDLQARPVTPRATGRRRAGTAKPRSTRATRRRTVAATAATPAAATAAPKATTPKAATRPNAAGTAKPSAAKPTASTPSAAPKAASSAAASQAAKPARRRAAKPAARRRTTRKPSAPSA